MQGKVEGDDFSRVVYVKGGLIDGTQGDLWGNNLEPGSLPLECMYMYVYICSPPIS